MLSIGPGWQSPRSHRPHWPSAPPRRRRPIRRRSCRPNGETRRRSTTRPRSASACGSTPTTTPTATGSRTRSPWTSCGRPRTETGLKAPVIMDDSPYYSTLGRGNESQLKVDDANGLLAKWPLFLDNYFVPRGYAIALVDMTGTNHSTGCPTVQGPTDNLAARRGHRLVQGPPRRPRQGRQRRPAAGLVQRQDRHDRQVLRRRAGRRDGGHRRRRADDDRRRVRPVRLLRLHALQRRHPARRALRRPRWPTRSPTPTGAPTASRCATRSTPTTPTRPPTSRPRSGRTATTSTRRRNVKASVFLTHGMGDENVRIDHFSRFWYALGDLGVQRKAWLMQVGHVDPFDLARRSGWTPSTTGSTTGCRACPTASCRSRR